MDYDYREIENGLFDLEFPDNLTDDQKYTLTENVIGIDLYENSMKVLMYNVQETDDLEHYYFLTGLLGGVTRREVHVVKMDDMRNDLFCTHNSPMILTVFDRNGKEIKKTAYYTPTISEVYENDDHIMLDIEFTETQELI